jgi:hypothetical protein
VSVELTETLAFAMVFGIVGMVLLWELGSMAADKWSRWVSEDEDRDR